MVRVDQKLRPKEPRVTDNGKGQCLVWKGEGRRRVEEYGVLVQKWVSTTLNCRGVAYQDCVHQEITNVRFRRGSRPS